MGEIHPWHAQRRCQVVDVIDTIEELLKLYPPPTHLRMDNGPEFIAHALQEWCTAVVRERRTSRQDHPVRTHLWSRSMAGLGMNCSKSSYLPRCKKQSCWQSSTGSSTTSTDRIRLSRGVRPLKSSSVGKRTDQTTSSQRNWSCKGGHISAAAGKFPDSEGKQQRTTNHGRAWQSSKLAPFRSWRRSHAGAAWKGCPCKLQQWQVRLCWLWRR